MSAQRVYVLVPWVLTFTTLGALALAGHAWSRREQRGARWLALSVFVSAVWTGFDLFNYVFDQPRIEVLLKCATWVLILIAGLAFFRFAAIYTHRESWWKAVRIPALLCVVANVLLMVTNPYHQWMWPGEVWVQVGQESVPWLESGPAFFWFFRPTACAFPLAAVAALALSAIDSPAFYLRQIAVLIAGAVLPVVVNILFVSSSAPGVDFTPVTVVVVISTFAVSTFRFGLLDVMPVARGLLFEQLDDGVLVLDWQNRVVDLNPAAGRLLRHERWKPGMAAGEIVSFWNELETRMATGDVQAVQTDLGGDPQTIVELDAAHIHADDGTDLGQFLVIHDVTKRARLAQELDAYAQTVAQDLKQPLGRVVDSVAAIRGGATVLTEASLRYLQRAEQVCRQMRDTVDALLCFAQLRSVDEIDRVPLDISAIVEATLRRLSALLQSANAEIVRPPQWPPAFGHPIWVEEIWTNYISNAIKYGGSPPRVEIGASIDGDRVRCWVRDNGPGLSPEQRSRLFTEFTRLEPKRSEGHGLGLSIVQRIAEKLGGTVGCDSAVGAGSTFWFTLSTPPGAAHLDSV